MMRYARSAPTILVVEDESPREYTMRFCANLVSVLEHAMVRVHYEF